ncbi:hypothetical protein [Sandarakinorhabdus sp. DWP1-3-1]|uniref:hypothetical protein n=1 Tax=Sandarakinorhabdus sp. DWP1-3-1 TaxID=2804627 RepID=UPI003CEEAE1D
MSGARSGEIGIVLVNWNRWQDSIECLESMFRSTIPVRVVVVDNASSDNSLDHIAAWAAGTAAAVPAAAAMAGYSQPPMRKPIACERFTAADMAGRRPDPAVRLTLIDSGGNLGFAGGNNVGLRWLLAQPQLDTFWLLNNDTVIDRNAAAAVQHRMAATDRAGMCGTVVRYYHRPDRVQALNGSTFDIWTGRSRGIGMGQPAKAPFDPLKVARETDFVLGASIAVSRAFLDAIGPMDEGYFLYYEELDWAWRNRGRFAIAFAHGAVVFHKEGGSIGSSGTGDRSAFSEYWLARSRLRFIARHRVILWPWYWLLTAAAAAARLLRGRPARAAALLRALFGLKY